MPTHVQLCLTCEAFNKPAALLDKVTLLSMASTLFLLPIMALSMQAPRGAFGLGCSYSAALNLDSVLLPDLAEGALHTFEARRRDLLEAPNMFHAANDASVERCRVQTGIAGGGHMPPDTPGWSKDCLNGDSPYAQPLRWTADVEQHMLRQGLKRMGRVWYDSGKNMKRSDGWIVDAPGDWNASQFAGTPAVSLQSTNSTIIHRQGEFFMWNHGAKEKHHNAAKRCVSFPSPVGIMRPNWILDSEGGGGALTQYMGTQYVRYGTEHVLMRLWRKTEPLENAYMILGFEAEPSWETPDGTGSVVTRARPLMRQTPGGPGVGDTVTYYFNHSAHFDDEEVFDALLNTANCSKRRSGGTDGIAGSFGSDNGTASAGAGFLPQGFGSLLNMNSGLHVDRSFTELVWNGKGDPKGSDDSRDTSVNVHGNPVADKTKVSDGDATAFTGEAVLMNTRLPSEKSALNADVKVTWNVVDQGSAVRISVTDRAVGDGWLGVSFPEEACGMVPATAVIAEKEAAAAYELVAANAVNKDPEAIVGLSNVTIERRESSAKLSFTVPVAEVKSALDAEGKLNVVYARGSAREVGYHGPNKACFTITVG